MSGPFWPDAVHASFRKIQVWAVFKLLDKKIKTDKMQRNNNLTKIPLDSHRVFLFIHF